MARPTVCPPARKWQEYIRDGLDPAEDSALTEHVQTCPTCEEKLASLIAPPRPPRTGTDSAPPPAPPELIDRLRRLWQSASSPGDAGVPATPPNVEGYEILGVLGRGGAGVVYHARDLKLGREVAIKMLVPGEYPSARDAQHLLRDAATAALLRHPHIVSVHAMGEHRGQPFFVMELISGGNLAQRLPDLVQSPRAAARLVSQVARALDHAHHAGVFHRDVKPANILLRVRAPRPPGSPDLDDLDACVTDFGLARRTREGTRLTLDDAVVGTPGYMAPEQIRSAAPALAADVYGLGAVLYECLTGQPPFRGATPFDALMLTLQAEVVRPRAFNLRLPRDLETICLKALEKEPGRRYASAAAFADDLERWLRGEPIRARSVGPLGRGWRWCRRKPLVAGLVAALALAVSGGLCASAWMWRQAVENEERALASEARARASLHNEAAARRDAEDEYAMLRASMSHSILNSSPLYGPADADQIREELLREADLSLNRLLERQPGDVQLRAQHARVLTQLGAIHLSQSRHAEAVATFERAADLWERLRDAEPHAWSNRAWRATAYAGLEQAHDRAGRQEPAQRYFEAAVRIWQEVIKHERNPKFREELLPAVVNARWVLVGPGIDWGDVPRRFKTIRERVDRMGGGEADAFIFDLLRLGYLWHQARLNVQSGYKENLLTIAREAAAILSARLTSPSLDRRYRALSASQSLQVCLWIRRAAAPEEALRLGVLANGALRELVPGDPDNQLLVTHLSSSWYEIGKINWDLHRAEECLTACRNAVEVQTRLVELAPAAQHRELLGARHMQLGRKLCELGRLDEAEVCFANRQALWPNDARKHDAALRELRKWAEEVGEAQNDWPAAPSQQRHRYLELCSRLERKGAGRRRGRRPQPGDAGGVQGDQALRPAAVPVPITGASGTGKELIARRVPALGAGS